jgi:SAM-dependent methyltransferase
MSTGSGWQLEGIAASIYEEVLVPYLFRPWADDLALRADVGSDSVVLDVGCGTGVAARAVAAYLGQQGSIIGLDVNTAMIEVARTIPFPSGVAVRWRVGSAEELPFADETFDCVVSQQALQFVPDLGKAAAEMFRVLRRGATAIISVWTGIENSPYVLAIMNAASALVSEAAGEAMRSPFMMGRDVLVGSFEKAGFSNISIDRTTIAMTVPKTREFVSGHLTALPFARQIAESGSHEALVNHILAALGGAVVDGVGTLPAESYVLTATR